MPVTIQPIEHYSLAQVVAGKLAAMISSGIYQPEQQLPSERDLISQFEVSRATLREALTTLSKSNLIEARPGAIYLAWKAGVPVLPVALTGCEDAVVVDRLKHFKRLHIRAVAGDLFTLPREVNGRDRDAVMKQYTDEVMCRIAALLPPERRGVYASHPRLKQLLGE